MDTNVERVKAKLDARSHRGIAKYGVTTAAAGLSPREWLTHLHEEMMDAVIYLEAHLAASAGAEVRDLTPEEAAASLERLDATLDRFAGRTPLPAAGDAERAHAKAAGDLAWLCADRLFHEVIGADGDGPSSGIYDQGVPIIEEALATARREGAQELEAAKVETSQVRVLLARCQLALMKLEKALSEISLSDEQGACPAVDIANAALHGEPARPAP